MLVGVTVVRPSNGGFVTVYPCGEPPPATSSLNFAAGENRANAAAAAIGAGRQVCVVATQPTDIIVDLAGWFG